MDETTAFYIVNFFSTTLEHYNAFCFTGRMVKKRKGDSIGANCKGQNQLFFRLFKFTIRKQQDGSES
jgi:hypothetical protein